MKTSVRSKDIAKWNFPSIERISFIQPNIGTSCSKVTNTTAPGLYFVPAISTQFTLRGGVCVCVCEGGGGGGGGEGRGEKVGGGETRVYA